MSVQDMLDFAQDPTVSADQLSMLSLGVLSWTPQGFHDKTIGGVHVSERDARGIVEACVLNPSANVQVWYSIFINCEHSMDQADMAALSIYSPGFAMELMSGMDKHYFVIVANSILQKKLRGKAGEEFADWYDDRMKPWLKRGRLSSPKYIGIILAYFYNEKVRTIFDATQAMVIKLFLDSTSEDWRKWAR